mmetsp:Transcript_125939/g.403213  ORF Transcript_125939/g.403213 Transcript_125939/m.403213 type:complete len:240 (+) Transcript_125939:122-841(+)
MPGQPSTTSRTQPCASGSLVNTIAKPPPPAPAKEKPKMPGSSRSRNAATEVGSEPGAMTTSTSPSCSPSCRPRTSPPTSSTRTSTTVHLLLSPIRRHACPQPGQVPVGQCFRCVLRVCHQAPHGLADLRHSAEPLADHVLEQVLRQPRPTCEYENQAAGELLGETFFERQTLWHHVQWEPGSRSRDLGPSNERTHLVLPTAAGRQHLLDVLHRMDQRHLVHIQAECHQNSLHHHTCQYG